VKKLQVFVSSTYTDLIVERQAVVQAILLAGHIPAGMELFAAGDRSQLDTIRQWIDESDVFVLIIGGRYGSIDPESGKSYIQLEYEYAIESKKPFFVAVMSDKMLDEKVKQHGKEMIERDNNDSFKKFKTTVRSRICRDFDDTKDLKLIVMESLNKSVKENTLVGWVRGDEVTDPKPLMEEIQQLRSFNSTLQLRVNEYQKKLQAEPYAGHSFEDLSELLLKENINVGSILTPPKKNHELSLFDLMLQFADTLIVGVDNALGMSSTDRLIFFTVAPKLAIYGLTEITATKQGRIQRFKMTPQGNKFLARLKPLVLSVTRDNKKGDSQQPKQGKSPPGTRSKHLGATKRSDKSRNK
jgi:hypothetical protein